MGLNRFDDLVVDLGISRNLLTARLHALIENGLVEHERSPNARLAIDIS